MGAFIIPINFNFMTTTFKFSLNRIVRLSRIGLNTTNSTIVNYCVECNKSIGA